MEEKERFNPVQTYWADTIEIIPKGKKIIVVVCILFYVCILTFNPFFLPDRCFNSRSRKGYARKHIMQSSVAVR